MRSGTARRTCAATSSTSIWPPSGPRSTARSEPRRSPPCALSVTASNPRAGDPMSRMARLPIRTRLTAGFTLAVLVVLIAAGVFVYWRFDVALNRDLDTELISSARTLAPLVDEHGKITDRILAAAPGGSWQVVDG